MSARSLAPGWAAAHLQRHWPTLHNVPDGVDMFAAHPVYVPRAERIILHPAKRPACRMCSGFGRIVDRDGNVKACPAPGCPYREE